MKGDARWGKRPERDGQIEELVNDRKPGFKAPPTSRKGQEWRESKGDAGEK